MTEIIKRKTRSGVVVSDKMKKTIVVKVERISRDAFYKKIVKKQKKYKVHDENNTAKVGDFVKIIETRPLSKEKRWRLVEIAKKN